MSWFWRCFFALLALVVPALVGYDVYFQWCTPALDLDFDRHTGLVYEVHQGTPADWAGFWAGDVILTVDGIPFSEWHDPPVGNYLVKVERDGQHLILELPVLPLAKVNLVSLVSAAAVALTFWGIGLLLLLRRFQQKEVRLLFLLAQTFAVLLLFPLAHPAPLPVPIWALTLSSASLYLAAPLLLHFYLTFPIVLGAPRQRRQALGATYGLALVSIILWRMGRPLSRLGSLYVILEVIAAVAILVYVYLRRATPDGRRRLRLVVFGNVMAAGPPILLYILPIMTGAPYHLPEWLVALFLVVAPLSYLYATVRHNLFGIDRFLNRTLVYALLSMGILILYLGPFLLIYRFASGDPLAQIMVAAGLTLLVGLAFDWSRTQVQQLVDRVFYGGWYDYAGVVETISDALTSSLDQEQLANVLTRQVPELMQLRPGHLWIGDPDETLPSRAREPYLCLAFTFEGQERGLWTVGPRRDGEDFSAADQRILETLAHQAEIALSNVLLVEALRHQLDEIRALQRQLLRSREAERARLARELHDSPIQALVGLNIQLGLLLAVGGKGSPPAEGLESIRAEVRELLSDLRQVCVELRPPMLDTLGLGAALRALAQDWSAQSGVTVHLDLPTDATLRPLSGETAVNLYRVVQEALSNVTRHAEARRITIRLAWEDTRLILIVQDDGHGFVMPTDFHSLTAQGHFGLVGMQERVDLIGGTLTVESVPGQGTTVRVIKNVD
ncbi:MAG: histidine kinase [Chloroflexota bacterium]|nr:histidine kinase [Chloroflexota bacterium]